jgi:hypothetical protein
VFGDSNTIEYMNKLSTEQTNHIPTNPLLRPLDVEYSPEHSLAPSTLPTSPFSVCGADITIDHSPDPSSNPDSIDISTYTAAAVRCLQDAEKRKFTRMGGGTVTSDTIPREEVLRTLQANNVLLQIWAICPHGSMGPMMRRFFLNDQPLSALQFGPTHLQAANMYRLSSLHPGLTGILPLADARWKRTRQLHEKFYGHPN